MRFFADDEVKAAPESVSSRKRKHPNAKQSPLKRLNASKSLQQTPKSAQKIADEVLGLSASPRSKRRQAEKVALKDDEEDDNDDPAPPVGNGNLDGT